MPEDNPARKSFDAGARTAREAMDRGTAAAEQATRQVEQSFAQANTTACMNFTSDLTHVKGPTEAFELWSRHAENHLQRLSEQSQDLAKLGQRIVSLSTEPLTRGVDQMFKRAS